MPKGLKIALGVVLAVFCLVSMGLIWLKDSSADPNTCGNCHAMQVYYDTWASGDYLANAHAESAIACDTCHTRTTQDAVRQQMAEVQQDYELPLGIDRPPAEDCLRCHEGYDAMLKVTEGDGEERNPHDQYHGKMDCAICHKMHKPQEQYCAQCHDDVELPEGWIVTKGK